MPSITQRPADGPLHPQRGLSLRPQVGDISQSPPDVWRCLVLGFGGGAEAQIALAVAALRQRVGGP